MPIIRCDEWTAAQVKAFRLLVNRSATWAEWDEELLAIEFGELAELNFDPTLTGFDPREIDMFMAAYAAGDVQVDSVADLPENPVSRTGDLWLCGKHRVLCGNSTSSDNVARLLGECKPVLMVTDPPYGIELDSEWRRRVRVTAGLIRITFHDSIAGGNGNRFSGCSTD